MTLFDVRVTRKTMLILSALLHVAALALLSGGSDNVVPEQVSKPLVVDATILPPPVLDKVPLPTVPEKTSVPAKAAKTNAAVAPSHDKTPDKVAGAKKTGIESTASKNESAVAAGSQGTSDAGAAATAGGAPAAAPAQPLEALKGASVDAPIQDGGFQIEYDVEIELKGQPTQGGAKFTFNKTNGGKNYQADLSGTVSLLKIGMRSEGEIRSDTLATTRFTGGGGVRGFKSRTGANFAVEYATQRMTFGKDGTQPLAYSAVYDYLSAMVYAQAVLQSRQGKISTMQLPVAKTKEVKVANVTFGAPERLSTAERNGEAGGVFESAIPAVIAIDSGGLKSMKVWFVPAKKYRPLRIELVFRDVTATLISRQSN